MSFGFDPSGLIFSVMPLSFLVWSGQMLVYHGIGYGLDWCDRHGHLASFKVRKREKLKHSELLPRVLFNQIFILLPAMLLMQWFGLAFTGEAQIGPLRFLIYLALMGLGHDIVQYIAHRGLLHQIGALRGLGHGLHHTTGASKAISACYMSGADFFLEIVLPYLLPLALIGGGGANVIFQLTIAGCGALGGLYEHSGYDFALVLASGNFQRKHPRLAALLAYNLSSKAHGEHHTRGNVSFSDGFGSPGICDSLFGTRWDKVERPKGRRVREIEATR